MNTVQFVRRRCKKIVSVQQYVVTHEGVNDEGEAEGQRDTQLLLSDFSEGTMAQIRHHGFAVCFQGWKQRKQRKQRK